VNDLNFTPSLLGGNWQVIEVAPTHCVVEISRSAGELEPYTEVYIMTII
jgi:hypothetical protein